MSQTQTPSLKLDLIYESPTGMFKHHILWVSRHSPLKAQIEALERKLGAIVVYQLSGYISDADEVMDVAMRLGAHFIIPVLPLSFIARLVELARRVGKTVLWAEMEQVKLMDNEPKPGVDYDPNVETVVIAAGAHEQRSYKIMRFKRFHVIKAVKLELEPW